MKDRERVFEKGAHLELMEFEDYVSFVIYC